MLKNTVLVTTLALLSGCASMSNEEYSQKTIAALSKSEENITQKIDTLNSHIEKQTAYIDNLESKIVDLNVEVELLKLRQQRFFNAAKNAKDEIIRNETATSNVVIANLKPQERSGMVTLGSLERVYIDIIKSDFIARVDTGATTSSINAIDIQEFERNGEKWVKFHVSDDETAEEDQKWVEAPVVRFVKIRQSSTESLERRPVIQLWVKIGQVHEKVQFTLADRTQMDYPILLGREFIQDVAFVDVSQKYIESKEKVKNISKQKVDVKAKAKVDAAAETKAATESTTEQQTETLIESEKN